MYFPGKIGALSAIFAILGTAAAAKPVVYDCALKDHTGDGWVAPRIVISFEEGADTAIVIDGIIVTVNKAPIVAKLTVRDKNSYKLNWAIDNLPVGNANTKERAQYVGVLNTKKMTLSVKAYLSYFDNTPRGSGKCTILKKK